MKNAYATKLRQTKDNAYADGVWNGLQMGLNLAAIALNHKFGFGESRLQRLEQKVQELVNEIVDTNDPIVTKTHIEIALKQIRGKGWVCDG
jgi:hypothetical protein